MTLHDIKKQNNRLHAQRGVTLLMTLMVVAALVAIIFSMTAITINELNNSNAEINSEPAITGAEAGAEELLYQDIRGSSAITCNATGSITLTNGVNVTYTNSLYYNGAATFNVQPNQEEDLFLYNPCTQNGAPGYLTITVNASPGNTSSNFNICSWNSTSCSINGDIYGTSFTNRASYNNLDPNTQYQLVIQNTSSTTAEDYTVTTTSNNPSVVTGLPASQVVIMTTGTKNGVTRKLQTTLPK